MALDSRMERFLRYRKDLARQRNISFNAPWRVFIIAAAALVLYYVWSVLRAYTGTSIPLGNGTIGDVLFEWFFYGMLLGVMFFALLFEGEYLLGVWKLAGKVEKTIECDAKRLICRVKSAAKAPAKRR